MTPKEAMDIALEGKPVVYSGIKYKCINSLICRVSREFKKPPQIRYSAELQSLYANSVMVAPVEEVELWTRK